MSKALDLSGLDGFNTAGFLEGADLEAANSGKPLLIPLDKILPDPDQPRKEFNPARLAELAASIRERGVKSPISVKPANEQGIYYINHGERRYWACEKAELKEIPAFIDDDHNHFDQMVENIQRDDLTPLEIAHFIERRTEAGDKKKDIAKALGKPASYISDHAVFFQFPDFVRDLYDSGRCRAIQALALLHRATKDFPERIADFCAGTREIPASEVRAFVQALKKESQAEEPAVVAVQDDTSADVELGGQSVSALPSDENPVVGEAPETLDAGDSLSNSATELEAELFAQFEEHLKPVENYLKAVTDPDFRTAAGSRLWKLAEKYGK